MQSKKTRRFIKKGKRGLIRIIFSRVGIISALFLLNVFWMFYFVYLLGSKIEDIYWITKALELIFVIAVFNSKANPSSKLTWLLVVSIPLFGPMLYLYITSDLGHRKIKHKIESLQLESGSLIDQDEKAKEDLEAKDKGAYSLFSYIENNSSYNLYENTDVTYYKIGEELFASMLEELEKAEHFIFLEYFIISEGEMWDAILDILKEKAKAGVEVRLMYDGFCEFSSIPRNYPKKLAEYGIKARPFFRLQPFVSTLYNYRDHRKIMVIDGKCGFTGGVNLADEYINAEVRFGHWKDGGIRLKGEAVNTLTTLFLQLWGIFDKETSFEPYLVKENREAKNEGFVIPFGTCPLEEDRIGEMVYLDMINRATESVEITTPYLILDGEMLTALTFAAMRGVEVRMLLPGVPDKKSIYALSKTHYKALISAGVHVYEYSPGFLHAKTIVADNKEAVVGTINFDYRSFYHHFECGVYMHSVPAIKDISKDIEDTIKLSREVTFETIKKEKLITKVTGLVLKQFAPLL